MSEPIFHDGVELSRDQAVEAVLIDIRRILTTQCYPGGGREQCARFNMPGGDKMVVHLAQGTSASRAELTERLIEATFGYAKESARDE
jgi:hypothetical protein